MTITAITRLSTQVAGKGKGGRVYTSRYRVVTNHREDSGISVNEWGKRSVYGSSGLPDPGDTYTWGTVGTSHYSFDDGAFAKYPHQVQLEQDRPGFERYWIALVTHESVEAETTKPDQQGDDPISWDWEESGDADEWTEEASKDNTGQPIVNSSLEVLTGKQVQVFSNRGRLNFAKNFPSLNSTLISDHRGAVNANAMTIRGQSYQARTLLMRRLRYQKVIYAAGTRYYFRHEFELDHNPETHDLRPVDRGFKVFDPEAGDRNDPASYVHFFDPRTRKFTQTPIFLDGAGAPLQAGQQAQIVNRGQGYRYYKERNLGIWGFPG